uniref:Uncharacterized protein n=1 Tax=Ixodes ricinus TaxID=34613 RepID=A0A6B0UQF5_IXORI
MNGPVHFGTRLIYFFFFFIVVGCCCTHSLEASCRLAFTRLKMPQGSGHATGRPRGMSDVKRVCELARGVQFVSARMFAGRAQFGLRRLVILRETFKQVLSVSSGSTPVQLFFFLFPYFFFFGYTK